MGKADLQKRPKKVRSSDYACQFREIDSPVHRIGAGWKLLFGMAFCAAAISVREPWSVGVVALIGAIYYGAARLTLWDLWRDVRFFLIQMTLIIGLYFYKYGIAGLWPGTRTSIQIVLFFIPGIVFLRTTQTSQLMRGLRKIMPYRLAFLIFICFRFVPVFARDIREIAMAQRIRGARLSPRELLNPRSWRDLFHCLMIPLIIRALKTADEASLSAEARGFGMRPERTYYDPEGVKRLKAEGKANGTMRSTRGGKREN